MCFKILRTLQKTNQVLFIKIFQMGNQDDKTDTGSLDRHQTATGFYQ